MPARAENADPFVNGRFGVRQGPQHVAADHQIETPGCEWELLGVRLLEAHGKAALGSFLFSSCNHRRREIDTGDAMPAGGKFEAQKPGAATGVERVESPPRRQCETEDPVPCRMFGGGADAVPEILIEMRRTPVPMSRDLLFDRIRMQ